MPTAEEHLRRINRGRIAFDLALGRSALLALLRPGARMLMRMAGACNLAVAAGFAGIARRRRA